MSDIGGGTSVDPLIGVLPLAIDPGIAIFSGGVWSAISPASIPGGVGWSYRKSYTKDSGKPFVGSSKTTYKTVSVLNFPGTLSGANIDRISAVLASKGNAGDVGIRVVDTSAVPPTIIAEASPLSVLDEAPVLYDLGVVSNLPPGPSIFEVQIKKVTEKCYLYDIAMDRG